MKAILLATAACTILLGGTALADGGSGASFSGPADPHLPRGADRMLPSDGSQGAVQSTNSLPPGFEDGMPTYESAMSRQAYIQRQNAARRNQQSQGASAGSHG